MKWETDFSKLPKFDEKRFAEKNYLCTTSGNRVVAMTWHKTEVRKKLYIDGSGMIESPHGKQSHLWISQKRTNNRLVFLS